MSREKKTLKTISLAGTPASGGPGSTDQLRKKLVEKEAELETTEARVAELRESLVEADEGSVSSVAADLAACSRGLPHLRNGVEKLRSAVEAAERDPDIMFGVVIPSVRFSSPMDSSSGRRYEAKLAAVLEVHPIGVDQLVTVRLEALDHRRFRVLLGRALYPPKEAIAALLAAARAAYTEGDIYPFRRVRVAEEAGGHERLKLVPTNLPTRP